MTSTFWSLDLSIATAVLAAVLAALFLWLAAAHIRRAGGGRGVWTVEILRILGAALLIVTLFRPERVRLTRQTERPLVAVVCDASGSMATRDVVLPGTNAAVSRADWLAARRAEKAWSALETAYDVVELDACVPPEKPKPDDDPGTDLNAALEETLKQPGRLRAVLLLSDGDWNLGAPPVSAATRLRLRGVPVYGVGVGRDQYLPDLDIQSVVAPSYGLLDEHISIPVVIQSRLPREVRTTLTLESPDGVVASKDLRLAPMAQWQGDISLVPQREGRTTFRLRLPAQPDEVDTANNEKEFTLSLRREVLKVLVVESQPRWEFRYLRNACLRDPGVDIRCLLLHPGMGPGGGRDYIASFPGTREELSSFDVVFLGDIGIDKEGLTEEQARSIRGLVEQQGSGLVFLPGPLGRQETLWKSDLGPLIPVEPDPKEPKGSSRFAESKLALTARGREHLLTLLAATPAQNEEVWKSLPGFYWRAGVLKARAGSEVLAVHGTERNENGRLPLLATRTAGNGKVLFMGTDSAWRWRRGVEDVYHYRFWGQVVRWMAHQRHLAHTEGIRFFHSPEQPKRGDRVFLHATVFDTAGLPLEKGIVTATVVSPSGAPSTVDLAPEPGGWGVFTGSFTPTEGGDHKLTVTCKEAGRELAAQVSVSRPVREKTGQPARFATLKDIAALTGGGFAGYPDLPSILEKINVLPEPRPVEDRLRLWCHPLWGLLVVFVLAAHWVGRKLIGKI